MTTFYIKTLLRNSLEVTQCEHGVSAYSYMPSTAVSEKISDKRISHSNVSCTEKGTETNCQSFSHLITLLPYYYKQ